MGSKKKFELIVNFHDKKALNMVMHMKNKRHAVVHGIFIELFSRCRRFLKTGKIRISFTI